MANLNGIVHVGGLISQEDIGTQISDAASGLAKSGGGEIDVIPGTYRFRNPIQLANAGAPVTLKCASGTSDNKPMNAVTKLQYVGTSGTAVNIAGSNGSQMIGCTLVGPGRTSSTTGLLVGGVDSHHSAIQNLISMNDIAGFGTCLEFGQFSFINTFLSNHIHGCGKAMWAPPQLNEFGENITFLGGSFVGDSAAYDTACVFLQSSGSLHFIGVSFDQCGFMLDALGGPAVMDFVSSHFEDPVAPTDKPFVSMGPSCERCIFNFWGGDFYEDGKSGRTSFIDHASSQVNNGDTINVIGTAFTPMEYIPQIVNSTGSAICCQRVLIENLYPVGGGMGNLIGGRWLGSNITYAGDYRASGPVASPALKLTPAGIPNCDAKTAGQFNYSPGGSGAKDRIQVCAKDAGDRYAWRTLY